MFMKGLSVCLEITEIDCFLSKVKCRILAVLQEVMSDLFLGWI